VTCAARSARANCSSSTSPICGSADRVTESVEACCAEPPELGNIPPSEFVPVAEQSGLIFELAEWVLPEACRMLAPGAAAIRGAHRGR